MCVRRCRRGRAQRARVLLLCGGVGLAGDSGRLCGICSCSHGDDRAEDAWSMRACCWVTALLLVLLQAAGSWPAPLLLLGQVCPTCSCSRDTVSLIHSLASIFACSSGSRRSCCPRPARENAFTLASFSHTLNRSISRSMDFRASIKDVLSFISAPEILASKRTGQRMNRGEEQGAVWLQRRTVCPP